MNKAGLYRRRASWEGHLVVSWKIRLSDGPFNPTATPHPPLTTTKITDGNPAFPLSGNSVQHIVLSIYLITLSSLKLLPRESVNIFSVCIDEESG